ncbi:ATP-binding cassette domain-containing protein [Jiangella alkaliphila]|uniref:ABC-2 type transport system ATP-binding protein n=1 Tax=Jiangella alkaliphila TaxID=419479 RepID=A0A1H2L2F3_9ACTN|nr:ABC transporter ATP-binding protein [Jiangella alkaliphila]SDU74935.1 ABC-2 type transport system ATP-binding protein [Jiangella alkaliphila]
MTFGIDIQNLTVRYPGVTAIDDLTLKLEGGKIYGLLGRNGSGKTTLLSLIAAYRRVAEGTILVDGESPFENERLTQDICLIRESGDIVIDGDSVKGILRRSRRFRPNWDDELAQRLLDLFQVPANRGVAKLSRGQKSALGITVGLASRAPLTMLDESYLGMDAPSRYAFYDVLLEDYMENPRTIILSTHLIEEVARLFEQVVIIDGGRLVAHDDTESLRLRGAAVVGPATAVDDFTTGMTILGEQRLGGTKSVTVYGDIDPDARAVAADWGLELSPVALQDLFVHLTKGNQA